MRRVFCFVVYFLCSTTIVAQTKTPITFDSYNAVGFLAGKSPVAFAAQTVNGLRFDQWFVGAGFGIDEYKISSLPLFIDVKKMFKVRHLLLYVYGDAGTHFTTRDKTTNNGFSDISTKGKLYGDAGIGIQFPAGKNSHVFLTVGNSLKTFRQIETAPDNGFPFSYSTSYQLNRISCRAGFRF